MKTLGIYQSHISPYGGVETFLYNLCWWLRNYFDITLIYCNADNTRLNKMKKLVKVVDYKSKDKFEFDIVIRNSVWGQIPDKIYSKENRYIEMRHANYKYLIDKGVLYNQYHEWDRTNEIVGCGEFVSEMSREVLHDNPTTIKNILLPRRETNKVLRLISCTRIDKEKGWNRMLKLAQMMKDNGIKFSWDIFTNNPQKCEYEEIHFWKPRYDIWDYLANADYTVLLSDSEGLSYTVQESLQYQVPVICTDVGGNAELIKDGANGYLVPLNMNFDINKIKNIPKCEEYDNGALNKWLDYLGYKEKIKPIEELMKESEESEMKVKVMATKKFEGIRDAERNVYPKEGDIWEVELERAEYLQEKGVIEIIKEEKINIGEIIEKKDWLNEAIKEKIEDRINATAEIMKLIEKEEPELKEVKIERTTLPEEKPKKKKTTKKKDK